jgi:large subunit ribosomal protein L40
MKSTKSANQHPTASIRYHLSHPLTPRPLHFSRNRSLRHWTIHRAWLLFLRKRRAAEALELERQYMSMRAACEQLRLMDSNGNQVSEAEAGGQGPDAGTLGVKGRDVGRLYRSAMIKRGVWGSIPVEYAKLQTDFPARDGWNHGWTRN